MAFGSKTQISNGVTVNSTTLQDASTAVTLNPGESAHVQVDADLTAGSRLLVYVQTTLDDSSENWDDSGQPWLVLDPATVDPNASSFVISGFYKFRLIYALDTGTNTATVSAWYRVNGVSL